MELLCSVWLKYVFSSIVEPFWFTLLPTGSGFMFSDLVPDLLEGLVVSPLLEKT